MPCLAWSTAIRCNATPPSRTAAATSDVLLPQTVLGRGAVPLPRHRGRGVDLSDVAPVHVVMREALLLPSTPAEAPQDAEGDCVDAHRLASVVQTSVRVRCGGDGTTD